MNKLKAAIYGLGFMGQTHYRNLIKMKEVSVVAVCDIDLEKTREVIDKEIKRYHNFDTMLETEVLDFLVICLPPFAHNGEFEKAAARGIHIFIEKPVALNTLKAKEMYDAAKVNNIISQVGYHQRFGSAIQKLKKYMEEGVAGKPCLFDGIYACNSLHAPWWRDKEKCGGQILEQVIHTYDMSMYLFGEPIHVSGMMGNICHQEAEGYTIEDVSTANIQFENGALASVCATNCAVPLRWDNPYQVIFENLVVKLTDPNHAEFIFTKEEKTMVVSDDLDLYYAEMQSFVQSVLKKEQTGCSIEDGYKSLLLVENVMNSALQEGKIMKL